MSFSIKKQAEVVVVDVEGQLIVGNRQELKQKVLDELEKGEKKFLIDFSQTGYIDSSGLGVLVSLSKKIREQGGELRLANLRHSVSDLRHTGARAREFLMAESRVAFDLQIPSDVEYIEGVVELARQRCREIKLSPTKCSLNVPVALTEALSNAILRGNDATGGKHVRVRAIISETDLVFEVVDEGPGFDVEECTVDCTTPENLTREEGRGLFLMRQLMDRVESFRDKGNVVRLTLRRP